MHFNCKPEPKCRVEGLSELAVKGVEVDPSFSGDIKEGQNASWPVHVHSNSKARAFIAGAKWYLFLTIIVPHGVIIPMAE